MKAKEQEQNLPAVLLPPHFKMNFIQYKGQTRTQPINDSSKMAYARMYTRTYNILLHLYVCTHVNGKTFFFLWGTECGEHSGGVKQNHSSNIPSTPPPIASTSLYISTTIFKPNKRVNLQPGRATLRQRELLQSISPFLHLSSSPSLSASLHRSPILILMFLA